MRELFTTNSYEKKNQEKLLTKATIFEKTIERNEVLAGLLNHIYKTRLLPIPLSKVSVS